ncbi:hypothetical protein [Falsibacillus albus]|uniref:hypothetical protein n=1 Tax=Falsibacillus albus TaxID=2478915 RepID=UPI0011E5A229|nr:hypothetical protein [Falsibacillus albus]
MEIGHQKRLMMLARRCPYGNRSSKEVFGARKKAPVRKPVIKRRQSCPQEGARMEIGHQKRLMMLARRCPYGNRSSKEVFGACKKAPVRKPVIKRRQSCPQGGARTENGHQKRPMMPARRPSYGNRSSKEAYDARKEALVRKTVIKRGLWCPQGVARTEIGHQKRPIVPARWKIYKN